MGTHRLDSVINDLRKITRDRRLSWDEKALKVLFDSENPKWGGRSAQEWLRSVNQQGEIIPESSGRFADGKLDRNALRTYCRDESVSDLECFVAVMAWGMMSAKNGRYALRSPERLIELVRQIRFFASDRQSDYELFYNARHARALAGIGPAYYTKLLFFLRPDDARVNNAYILDQWTSKSVHVLTGSRRFPMLTQSWVADKVSPEDYETYCRIVDTLSLHMGCSGSEVEERMFSSGSRTNAGRWRKYVREQWRRLPT
jgi:hypothetical protein